MCKLCDEFVKELHKSLLEKIAKNEIAHHKNCESLHFGLCNCAELYEKE